LGRFSMLCGHPLFFPPPPGRAGDGGEGGGVGNEKWSVSVPIRSIHCFTITH